jgi:hypothetical protein
MRRLKPLPEDEYAPFAVMEKTPGEPHRQYGAQAVTFGAKVLRKEYKTLADALPQGIYVRAYEVHMPMPAHCVAQCSLMHVCFGLSNAQSSLQ